MEKATFKETTAAPPKPTTPKDVLGKPETHTVEFETTQDGYKQTATLTLYPGVAGREAEHLAAGWTSVGGQGEQPCSAQVMQNLGVTQQTTYYVFGTLTLRNESAGFDPPKIGWAWMSDGQRGGVLGLGYSRGGECNALAASKQFAPDWKSDTWGPIPVVIGLAGIYSPKNPDGDTQLMNSFHVGAMPMGYDAVTTIDGVKMDYRTHTTISVPAPSTISSNG